MQPSVHCGTARRLSKAPSPASENDYASHCLPICSCSRSGTSQPSMQTQPSAELVSAGRQELPTGHYAGTLRDGLHAKPSLSCFSFQPSLKTLAMYEPHLTGFDHHRPSEGSSLFINSSSILDELDKVAPIKRFDAFPKVRRVEWTCRIAILPVLGIDASADIPGPIDLHQPVAPRRSIDSASLDHRLLPRARQRITMDTVPERC